LRTLGREVAEVTAVVVAGVQDEVVRQRGTVGETFGRRGGRRGRPKGHFGLLLRLAGGLFGRLCRLAERSSHQLQWVI